MIEIAKTNQNTEAFPMEDSIKNIITALLADDDSALKEQFRTLRTNINFMAIDHPIKTLALTSAGVSE